MSFVLTCDCGKQMTVTEGSAGASLPCGCGRTIHVPTLGQLRQLPGSDGPPHERSSGEVTFSEPAKTGEAEKTPEQIADALCTFVAEQMQNGVSDADIEQQLVGYGLGREAAESIVSKMREARRKVFSDAGRRNMLIGGVVCVIGLGVTLFTFQAAAAGGGRYIIAWGAIAFGAIQFFRGIFQMSKE